MEGEGSQLQPAHRAAQQDERPAAWLCSLGDYRRGLLHGRWINVTGDATALEDEVRDLLDTGLAADGTWAVLDQRGFGGLRLRHNESLSSISRLAIGVVDHGEPFVHWAKHRGYDDVEALDQFENRYLGRYADLVSYVGYIVTETESSLDLNHLPPALRSYARFSIDRMARRWAKQVHATRALGGGWHLFDNQ